MRRTVSPVIVLAVLALIPTLLLFAFWRWADGRAEGADPPPSTLVPPPAPSAALTTPLLSFRRTPAVVARDVSIEAFRAEVAAFGATLADPSCVAVAVDGVDVGATRGDVPLIPASNQKLLVGAVALDVLGGDHTFTTEVRSAPPSAGVVAGDLYLVGGGDPLLTSSTYPVQNDVNPVTDPTSLDALADAVVAAGVSRVDGAVVGDGTRYDDELYAPSWVNDVRGIEAGPYDALLVNDARVTGDPLRAADPAEAAARELTQLLTARGVTVAGTPAAGTAPGDLPVVASVQSAPMSAVVGEMLSTSDNNTAELLVKELGVAAGSGGTREEGLAVIARTLGEWGVPMDGVVLADGSGLSNDNRVTCNVFVDVLARSGPTDPLGAGLPVAGVSGTLSDVFTESAVSGRLQAKTGTLGNAPYNADPPAVKTLSGYLPVEGGGAVEFSLLLNATGTLTDQSVYRPIWDAFVALLATYPSGPTPAELGRVELPSPPTVSAVAVMPMFPLGSVLLPGGVLPLHVFEPRYRQLVVDCLADDSGDPEFGVTMIERGSEVGGGDQRSTVGVVARMIQVNALDDGRYTIVAVGTQRIRVNAWLPDDPYPLADVDVWPDADTDAEGLDARVADLTARLAEVLAVAAQLGEVPADVDLAAVSDDPLVASYHLAALSPIGPADRYRLLCAATPAERLDLLAECLDDVEAMLRFRLT